MAYLHSYFSAFLKNTNGGAQNMKSLICVVSAFGENNNWKSSTYDFAGKNTKNRTI